MHFHFTEEDEPTHIRARDLRVALVHAQHKVTLGRLGEPAPPDADAWFHGLGWNPTIPPTAPVAQMRVFRGDVVVFQACDHVTMHVHRIPPELRTRARRFLRNHWPSDDCDVPDDVKRRWGLIPPMLRPFPVRAGDDLRSRPNASMFYGTRTGGHFKLPDGSNARETLVRAMRASGVPFEGGLSPNANAVYAPDPSLMVPRMKDREHTRRLSRTKLCLAPWGNHPLTYRLFEGLALRCLVLAQSIASTRFIDGGLEAGRHYVELRPDLSDLADKARYYLDHLDEAQRIADAGHALYVRRFAYRGAVPSRYTFEESVKTWGSLYRPAPPGGRRATALALGARFMPSLF